MSIKINQNNIVVIGPVLPFRGGISQHTTMLKRALAETSNVLMISFSRQYPAWLFPGESDRDPSYDGHQESQTEYMIDSLNPFSWKRAVNRVIQFNAQTVVIPWWTVFWAPCFGYIAWMLNKKGIHVVFFCHNVVEHEAAAWKSFLTKNVLKNAQRFVVHTREDQSNLQLLLPDTKISVYPHPIYDHFPVPIGKLVRRRALELLFYGFVRPYKGLDDLIQAMVLVKGLDIQLTIAGEFWKGEEETRQQVIELGLEEQIEIRPRYHTDQETAELFARADVVVLPYRSATGSGVVPIAYHYNKPVIVTQVGGLPDVVEHAHTGFIIPVRDIEALASILTNLKAGECQAMQPAIEKMKQHLSWEGLASTLLSETTEN